MRKERTKAMKILAWILAVVILTAVIAVPLGLRQRGNLQKIALPQNFSEDLLEIGGAHRDNSIDARIMSANVLVSYKSWGGEPVKPRAKQFVELMQLYAPDVVGLQEASSDWHACIEQNLTDYEFIHPQNNLFQKSLTTLIYNTKTLKLLDSGRVTYSEGDGTKHRAITWGVFETLADGKVFAVSSTHLDLIREGKEEEEYAIMSGQVDELFALLETIRAQYDCPIFCTGDYNSMENGSENGVYAADGIYQKLAGTLTDTKFAARNQAAGEEEAWDFPSWDHIFLQGEAEVVAFRVLSDTVLKGMSDHYPIYADIRLP